VTASSGSLAFTGPGKPFMWVTLLGALLVVVGIMLLALVDAPRRFLARLTILGVGSNRAILDVPGREPVAPRPDPGELWVQTSED
jgi:hypothetical protein